MEKRKPSLDLASFKAACGDPARLEVTVSALRTALEIGFGRNEIAVVIRSMRRAHFYKSMTSHGDHRIWQDVYHVPHEDIVLYVKFTNNSLTGFTVLSFKEK